MKWIHPWNLQVRSGKKCFWKPLPQGSLALDFCYLRFSFPAFELFTNRTTQSLFFVSWLLSDLHLWDSSMCSVVINHFNFIEIYHILFLHSALGHLGYFQFFFFSFLDNMKSAAINILLQIFWYSCAAYLLDLCGQAESLCHKVCKWTPLLVHPKQVSEPTYINLYYHCMRLCVALHAFQAQNC